MAKNTNNNRAGKVVDFTPREVVAQFVRAKRGDRETSFSRKTWDMLPPGKLGWEEIMEEPEELKGGAPTLTAEEIELAAIRTKYLECFGFAATEALTLADMQNAIEIKNQESDAVLYGLIERYKTIFGEAPTFAGPVGPEELKAFEDYVVGVEAHRAKEEEDKAEAEANKPPVPPVTGDGTPATPAAPAEGNNLAPKLTGAALKASQKKQAEAAGKTPSPEELLSQITKKEEGA